VERPRATRSCCAPSQSGTAIRLCRPWRVPRLLGELASHGSDAAKHVRWSAVSDTVRFRIGSSNREYVIVHPSRRERPEASYSDGNWVYAIVKIAAGAFRGKFEAQLRADEFASFRDQLLPLHEKLVGRAK